MSFQKFYITKFDDTAGLNTYWEPFLIPEKASTNLFNLVTFRGRITKKPGAQLLGQLTQVTTFTLTSTNGTSTYVNADILSSVRSTEPNANLQIGSIILTLDPGGANESIYKDKSGSTVTPGIINFVSGPYGFVSGTINYITGALSLITSVAPANATVVHVSVSYYPALPVMGIRTRVLSQSNREDIIIFDTKYAYYYNGLNFLPLPSTTPVQWTGADWQFFWTCNYFSNSNGDLFWATNFNHGASADLIYYWDTVTWTSFQPTLNAGGSKLQQCRFLVPYKDRLLALNTWEGTTYNGALPFPNRIRWSQVGDPTDQTNGWLADVSGRGGFVSLPTSEPITGVEFIKDILLIKTETISWKILYTGNKSDPFLVQKINTEFGSESPFSLIPFDRGVFTVGDTGITTDDGINVQRIDQSIPDTVFSISDSNQGTERVYGIRDYTLQYVYWTYPDYTSANIYPNRILCYNYIDGIWSQFDDSFTCFGYYFPGTATTWATLPYDTWAQWDDPWNYGNENKGFPSIAAGNQNGFVFQFGLYGGQDGVGTITAITTSGEVTITAPNHNLVTGQWVYLEGIIGTGTFPSSTLNDNTYLIEVSNSNQFKIYTWDIPTQTQNNVVINTSDTYIGGGTFAPVPNFIYSSKRFSPFFEEGTSCQLKQLNFFVAPTTNGQAVCNIYINESSTNPVNDPSNENVSGLMNSNILRTSPTTTVPYQAQQNNLWVPVFANVFCQNFQLVITMNNDQMSTYDIARAGFTLQALMYYARPTGRLLQ